MKWHSTLMLAAAMALLCPAGSVASGSENATTVLLRAADLSLNPLMLRQETSDGAESPSSNDPFTVPTLDFSTLDAEDPTAPSYNTPLPADTIAGIQAVTAQSIQYAEQGVVVSPSGEVLPDKPARASWVNVVDKSGHFQLLSAPTGNFHFAEAGQSGPGATFESNSNVIARDDQLQGFFYFPDTMAKYGVSRWRHAPTDRIPRGSRLATLVPVKGVNGDRGTYVVSDTLGNYFFPIMCTYADGTTPSRLFLAKSVSSVAALKEPTMQTLITGGAIKDCGYFALVSQGFAGF